MAHIHLHYCSKIAAGFFQADIIFRVTYGDVAQPFV